MHVEKKWADARKWHILCAAVFHIWACSVAVFCAHVRPLGVALRVCDMQPLARLSIRWCYRLWRKHYFLQLSRGKFSAAATVKTFACCSEPSAVLNFSVLTIFLVFGLSGFPSERVAPRGFFQSSLSKPAFLCILVVCDRIQRSQTMWQCTRVVSTWQWWAMKRSVYTIVQSADARTRTFGKWSKRNEKQPIWRKMTSDVEVLTFGVPTVRRCWSTSCAASWKKSCAGEVRRKRKLSNRGRNRGEWKRK